MTFVPAPGIIQLNAIFQQAGQSTENTFHYHTGATIDRALLQAMATTYLMWFTANAGLFSNAVALTLIYLRDLTTQESQTFDFVPHTTADGTRTSPMLPNNVTLAIKRETGLAGRSRRGRIYWPGITEDMQSSSNEILTGTAATLAVQLNTLLSSQLSDNSVTEVIYHRKVGTGTPVVGYTITDLNLDSQRRRLPGHNRHH